MPPLYLQSPVGNRTDVRALLSSGDGGAADVFPGSEVCWLASGTAALAAAVAAAVGARAVGAPRVALPAYGCPDVVAAVRAGGAEPLFVDLAADRPWMDLGQLGDAVASDTRCVAIVGVDLFGIAERWAGLREIAARHGLTLIQDCAQSVQATDAGDGADFRVFSFGRGKPVCLMGGGAAVAAHDADPAVRDAFLRVTERASRVAVRPSATKLRLYNALLNPYLYALAARALGSRLGRTVYEPLDTIAVAPDEFAAAARRAVASFRLSHRDRREALERRLGDLDARTGSVVLSRALDVPAERILSRLPVLLGDAAARDRTIDAMTGHGIGATAMYEQALPDILARYRAWDGSRAFPAAIDFAARLVTLPLHARLSERDLSAMRDCLARGRAQPRSARSSRRSR